MKVIGLTGGIGSGKSTVSRFLAEMGAAVVDADKLAREALENDTETKREVVTAFGRRILTPGGRIDRVKLGEIVFGSPESLAMLNRIMHPRIYDMVKASLEGYQRRGEDVVVLEAPLLMEGGWAPLVDEVWVTIASEAAVLKRLKLRAGLSGAEARARIRSQISNEERVKRADVVINNDGSLADLEVKVRELWQALKGKTRSEAS
jgi:dephospho-CoA kinase